MNMEKEEAKGFTERVKGILEQFVNLPTEYEVMAGEETCIMCGFPLTKEKREEMVEHYLTQLLSEILSKLPKEKDWLKNLKIDNPIRKFNEGYNQAIQEAKRALNIEEK